MNLQLKLSARSNIQIDTLNEMKKEGMNDLHYTLYMICQSVLMWYSERPFWDIRKYFVFMKYTTGYLYKNLKQIDTVNLLYEIQSLDNGIPVEELKKKVTTIQKNQ